MGIVGEVGDWRDCCVPVTIGRCKYHYNPDTGIWYDSNRETDFYIPFDLDGMVVHFSAEANRFYRGFQALSNTECQEVEKRVKEKLKKEYKLDGEVSRVRFFQP